MAMGQSVTQRVRVIVQIPNDMKILIAIDSSDTTQDLITAARSLIPRDNNPNQIQIWILHVAEPDPAFVGFEAGPTTVRVTMAKRYRREHRDLQLLADGMRKDGYDCTALLIQGSTIETIVDQAERLTTDVIVAGTHGHGRIMDAVVGNLSSGLLRKPSTPMLMVPLNYSQGKEHR